MMIEKSGTIRLKDIHIPQGGTPEQQELAQGMVRVNHLYRSALKVAVTQLEILDEEFASLYDHSPIHHIEYRIKTVDSIVEKLKRRGFEVTIDNIYAHIQDVAGVRVICNYLDDICYLRSLLARNENFKIIREVNYIKEPKESGYRSLHLICDVPIVISEGTLHLPVEIQLRTIAMDMWACLEHELRYKSQRDVSPPAAVLRRHQRDRPGDAGHLSGPRPGIPRITKRKPDGFLFVMLCHTHIFSGAVQPMRVMAFFSTDRAVSASFSRASSTGRSSPLMRQAV